MSYSEGDTEWMANIGAGILLESESVEAFCPQCMVELHDTDEPDYKKCPKCGQKYWVVVGYSGIEGE